MIPWLRLAVLGIAIALFVWMGAGPAQADLFLPKFDFSHDANLSGLDLRVDSTFTLSPDFTPGTTSYTLTIFGSVMQNYVVQVKPAAQWSQATIKVNGQTVDSGAWSQQINVNLLSGDIGIVVTAQDGTTTGTYTLHPAFVPLSSDADLSGLATTDGIISPAFAPGTTSYSHTTDFGTTAINVWPTAAEAHAAIKVNGQTVASGQMSQAIVLSVGDNAVTIVVTAQDGVTTKTYTLTVTRPAAALSSDADLSGLATSDGSVWLSLDPNTLSYSHTTSVTTSAVRVKPTAADNNATIKVNGQAVASGQYSQTIDLSVGDNPIAIKITAQDGVTAKTYTLTVTRPDASTMSADCNLSGLDTSLGAVSPSFDPGNTGYSLVTANANAAIRIKATAEETHAAIKVQGLTVAGGQWSPDISLDVGTGTVSILVTAQNGTTARTYTLTVTREPAVPTPSTDCNLSGLDTSLGAASPSFDPGHTGYSLVTANADTAIRVKPTAADSNATIKVNGQAVVSGQWSQDIPLSVGDNTVTVLVTAQDGHNRTYTLTVTRPSAVATPGQSGPTVIRYYIGRSDYFVNDQAQSMDTAPIIRDGRTLLPIRYVATPLGAGIAWDAPTQKVTVSLDGKTIELWIGNNTARVDGAATPIDAGNPAVAPVIVPPGRTMLPLRFIAENLGCRVDWDQAQQQVTVTYPAAGL